ASGSLGRSRRRASKAGEKRWPSSMPRSRALPRRGWRHSSGLAHLHQQHVPRWLHRGPAWRAFDFGPMDDGLLAAYTELLRNVGTFLYGRRLYETMAGWETMPALAAQ